MPLPHDFRAQARQPIPVNGKGAPLQISGSKLQENFEYLDKKEVAGGSSLPDGEYGAMLYYDNPDWVLLLSPGTPSSGYKWTLQHDGNVPEWVEYKEITVSICEDGTPTEYTILGLPTA
jgi:hypothetical protein